MSTNRDDEGTGGEPSEPVKRPGSSLLQERIGSGSHIPQRGSSAHGPSYLAGGGLDEARDAADGLQGSRRASMRANAGKAPEDHGASCGPVRWTGLVQTKYEGRRVVGTLAVTTRLVVLVAAQRIPSRLGRGARAALLVGVMATVFALNAIALITSGDDATRRPAPFAGPGNALVQADAALVRNARSMLPIYVVVAAGSLCAVPLLMTQRRRWWQGQLDDLRRDASRLDEPMLDSMLAVDMSGFQLQRDRIDRIETEGKLVIHSSVGDRIPIEVVADHTEGALRRALDERPEPE